MSGMQDMGAHSNPPAAIVPRLLPRYAHDTQAAEQIPALASASRWRDVAEPAPPDEVAREHPWQAPPWIDGAADGHADPSIFPQADSVDEHAGAESAPAPSSDTPGLSALPVEAGEAMVSGSHDAAGATGTGAVPAIPMPAPPIQLKAASVPDRASPAFLSPPAGMLLSQQHDTVLLPNAEPGISGEAASLRPGPSKAESDAAPPLAPGIQPADVVRPAADAGMTPAGIEPAAGTPGGKVELDAANLPFPADAAPAFRSPSPGAQLNQQHDESRRLAIMPQASVDRAAAAPSGLRRGVPPPLAAAEAQATVPGASPAPEARAPRHAGRNVSASPAAVLPIAEPGNPGEVESDAAQAPAPEIRPADLLRPADAGRTPAGIERVPGTPGSEAELDAASLPFPAEAPPAFGSPSASTQLSQQHEASRRSAVEAQATVPGAFPTLEARAPRHAGRNVSASPAAVLPIAEPGNPGAAESDAAQAPAPQIRPADLLRPADAGRTPAGIEHVAGTPGGNAEPGAEAGDRPAPQQPRHAALGQAAQSVPDKSPGPPQPASIVPAEKVPLRAEVVQTPALAPQPGAPGGATAAAGARGKSHTPVQEARPSAPRDIWQASPNRQVETPAPPRSATLPAAQASSFTARSAIEPGAGALASGAPQSALASPTADMDGPFTRPVTQAAPAHERQAAQDSPASPPPSARIVPAASPPFPSEAAHTPPLAPQPGVPRGSMPAGGVPDKPHTQPAPVQEAVPFAGRGDAGASAAGAQGPALGARAMPHAAMPVTANASSRAPGISLSEAAPVARREKQTVQDRPASPPPSARIVPTANRAYHVGAVKAAPLEGQPGIPPGAMSAARAPREPHPRAKEGALSAARHGQPAAANAGHVPPFAASSTTEPRVVPRRLLDGAQAPATAPVPLQSAARHDARPGSAPAARRATPAAKAAQAASLALAPQANPKAAPVAEKNRHGPTAHLIAPEAAIAPAGVRSPPDYRPVNPSAARPTPGGVHAIMPLRRSSRATPAPAAAPAPGIPASRPGKRSVPPLQAHGPATPQPGLVRISGHPPATGASGVAGNLKAPPIPGHRPHNASAITPQRAPQAPARAAGAGGDAGADAGAGAGQDAPVTVRVNIGRIRIEGAPAPAPQAPPFRRPAPALSLAQYAQRRNGRRP